MFEKASRLKLRYVTHRGVLTTEDLWDLSLTELDSAAKKLNKSIKEQEEGSFIAEKSKVSTELELSFEIVKHIIKVKLEEKEIAKQAAEKRARKQQILELISQKENEALSEKSIEELRKELEE